MTELERLSLLYETRVHERAGHTKCTWWYRQGHSYLPSSHLAWRRLSEPLSQLIVITLSRRKHHLTIWIKKQFWLRESNYTSHVKCTIKRAQMETISNLLDHGTCHWLQFPLIGAFSPDFSTLFPSCVFEATSRRPRWSHTNIWRIICLSCKLPSIVTANSTTACGQIAALHNLSESSVDNILSNLIMYKHYSLSTSRLYSASTHTLGIQMKNHSWVSNGPKIYK